MLPVALALAALAALVHVYIFVIESLQFEKPSTLRAFGVRPAEAAVMKPWAYNQGFYNLFLAVETALGIGLVGSHRGASVALVTFACASMVGAALVLVTSDRSKLRGAAVQGTFPALALLGMLTWWLTR